MGKFLSVIYSILRDRIGHGGQGLCLARPGSTIVWIGISFFILIEGLFYIAAVTMGGQPSNASLIFGFDNYRFFNHVQTITLPLLALLISRRAGTKPNIFAWAVTSIWWALLFVTAGRGTFIGLVAGVLVSWGFLRKAALPWCRIMLWSALIGLGIYILFYVLVPLSLGLQPFGFLFSVVERTVKIPVPAVGQCGCALGSSCWRIRGSASDLCISPTTDAICKLLRIRTIGCCRSAANGEFRRCCA
jgi:hypothetical protein